MEEELKALREIILAGGGCSPMVVQMAARYLLLNYQRGVPKWVDDIAEGSLYLWDAVVQMARIDIEAESL